MKRQRGRRYAALVRFELDLVRARSTNERGNDEKRQNGDRENDDDGYEQY